MKMHFRSVCCIFAIVPIDAWQGTLINQSDFGHPKKD